MKRSTDPQIAVSQWVPLLIISLSHFLVIFLSLTHECPAFFLPELIFFKKLVACSKGTDVSVRTRTGHAVQVGKCHVQEKGISQPTAWSHAPTFSARWGTRVPRGHRQQPSGTSKHRGILWPMKSERPEIKRSLAQTWMSNSDSGVPNWHHCRQREIAAELLSSLLLMHDTPVHSFPHFAGVFRKPYNIPQTKKLNFFQVKNLLNVYKLANIKQVIFHYFK